MPKRDYYNTQFPYINVWMGDSKTSYSLTINPADNRPDYFVSLQHKRCISEANTCTMSVKFVPSRMKDAVDPNWLEYQIAKCEGIVHFQYGFQNIKGGGTELSDEYIGRIHSYTASVGNGVLTYNLSIVSQSVEANYESIDNNDDKLNLDITYKDGDEGNTTSEEILDIMEKVVEASDALSENYFFDKDNSCKADHFKPTRSLSCYQQTPLQYLNEIASTLVTTSEDKDDINNIKFKIVVDDTSQNKNKKYPITLHHYNPKANTSVLYDFEWGTKDSDVVSWAPSYNGTFMIFNLRQIGIDEDEDNDEDDTNGSKEKASIAVESTSNEGVLSYSVDKSVLNDPGLITDTISSNAIKSLNEFNEAAQYPYTARLTVLGLTDKKLTLVDSIVEIHPYLNGIEHHSGGRYYVTGITDNVSSDGFTTELELTKLVSDDDKEK